MARSIKIYSAGVLIVAFAFAIWFLSKSCDRSSSLEMPTVAMSGLNEAPLQDVLPTIIPATVVANLARLPAGNAWSEISQAIVELDSADQAGLDRLYEKAKTEIEEDPASAKQWVIKTLSSIDFAKRESAISDEEIFFTVSAWIRYSGEPTRPTEWLAAHRPAPSPLDSQHLAQSPAIRHDRVWAYSLRELRTQIEKKTVSWRKIESEDFLNQLSASAKTEKSLDVSIEIFHLLQTLNQPESIQTALEVRSTEERELLQATLE